MSHAKPSFMPTPRMLTAFQVACRLNKSEQWFSDNRERLERLSFPTKDKVPGGWDSNAIEAWFDRRMGMRNDSAIEAAMLDAIHGKDKSSIRASGRHER